MTPETVVDHEITKLQDGPPAERTEQSGSLGWYRELDGKQRKTFWACFAGWSLDAMDVQLYSFIMPALIGLWSLSNSEAGLAASVALLASSLGGWVVGILSDRVGRVRMLQITILWFSFFTFLCAFAQTYEQLLVLRALQGFGFGGEWAAGAVLIAEVVGPKHRGKGSGFVQSGWAVGWASAAILYMVFFTLLPDEYAWRALFAFGLLPAVLVIFLRRMIEEPETFVRASKNRASAGHHGGFLEIFSPALRWTTIRACALAIGAHGGFYAITIWLPTYLHTELGLSVLTTGGYLAVVILASFVGYITGAYLNDYLGRRKTLFLFAAGASVTVAIYMLVPLSQTVVFLMGLPLGFFPSGVYSGVGTFFSELYPTRVRGSGVGFSYNFGRAVGSTFPTLVGLASTSIALGTAIGLLTAAAYSLTVMAALLLPETVGKPLDH